ncbi:BatA domain-containing protein [Luteolibacter ambystomatis]|uniref:BatA domain-containing protein n=1 Tax=Luteolibacter ambystomatis TaxID=2824561 RepID=A0A975IZR4_9BACT|nr:BatA and WFA domain-containing protein [Luteolibacter ambystomatis]QUE51524.1 BatA domain-containing protein [Luteolibacter ambystomatis]
MSFLQQSLLWFTLAAAIPVIIHLLNKRRHKTIRWAAMQFLLKATKESRGKKKLRHILILTCRALGLAMLAIAAARPVMSGLLGWNAGRVDNVILILDRSASMELRPGDGFDSRRAQVLEKVRNTFKDLGGARLVLIDSASGQPQEVPSPDVLPDLTAAGPSDTAADLPALATRAAEFLTEIQGRSEVWIATDLQASNWKAADERWAAVRASLSSLPSKPSIRVLGLTGPTAANTSLRLASARRIADQLVLDLEVTRAEDARGSVNLPLTVNLNGARTTETLTLTGQALKFQKRITLPSGSTTGHGWLSIPADGNPRDNAAFFAYGPDRPAKSIVVAGTTETANYLQLSAAPPGFANQSVTRVDPAKIASLMPGDAACILWSAPLPTGPTADMLQRYLSEGGQVVFFPPAQASELQFLELKWSPPQEAATGKFFILKDWNHDDGPLRDGADGTTIPAERLKAIRRQIPTGDAASLAKWDDGEAFLVRKIVDRGTAWFVASQPDYTWSNLGDADVLLPLVQRTVMAGGERFDASYLSHVGSEASKLQPGETRTRLDDYGTPDPANASWDAGIYKLGDRLIALNRPTAEDAPEIVSHEGIAASLDGTGYTLFEQAGKAADTSASRGMWKAFLCAVLFFLLSEAVLSLPKKSSRQPTASGRATTNA